MSYDLSLLGIVGDG